MIVALDGPAGVGKSTVAQCIALKANLLYVNSGNFYRGITYFILKRNIPLSKKEEIISLARNLDFNYKEGHLVINDFEIEDKLHNDQIDIVVAPVSSIIEVRAIVNKALHETTKDMDIIVEGRDITTVVFPDADIKIYLDASVKTRAKRRWSQGVSTLSLIEIEKSIKIRDRIDKNKKEGSLKISSDALYFDTSDLTIEQVCEKVVEIINNCNTSIQEK